MACRSIGGAVNEMAHVLEPSLRSDEWRVASGPADATAAAGLILDAEFELLVFIFNFHTSDSKWTPQTSSVSGGKKDKIFFLRLSCCGTGI